MEKYNSSVTGIVLAPAALAPIHCNWVVIFLGINVIIREQAKLARLYKLELVRYIYINTKAHFLSHRKCIAQE